MLVIGAEPVSRMVDLDDPETALVFGDGAGALVLYRQGLDSAGTSVYCRTSGGAMGRRPK